MPGDAAAACVDDDPQGVDRDDARGGEEALRQLTEPTAGAHALAQVLGRLQRALDPLAPVHREATAGDVDRQHQQRARTRGLHRAERTVDQRLEPLYEWPAPDVDQARLRQAAAELVRAR